MILILTDVKVVQHLLPSGAANQKAARGKMLTENQRVNTCLSVRHLALDLNLSVCLSPLCLGFVCFFQMARLIFMMLDGK